MLNQENLNLIKETVSEFFVKMTTNAQVEVIPQDEQIVAIAVRASEPQLLIGEAGQTLMEIQQLLRLILRKKISEPFFVDLDINDYKKDKSDYLRKMAQTAADEVSVTRQEKWLLPMTAYERRIIHMELASRNDIVVESRGEEPERRIVIKPLLYSHESLS